MIIIIIIITDGQKKREMIMFSSYFLEETIVQMGCNVEIGETESQRNMRHMKNILFSYWFPQWKILPCSVYITCIPPAARLERYILFPFQVHRNTMYFKNILHLKSKGSFFYAFLRPIFSRMCKFCFGRILILK